MINLKNRNLFLVAKNSGHPLAQCSMDVLDQIVDFVNSKLLEHYKGYNDPIFQTELRARLKNTYIFINMRWRNASSNMHRFESRSKTWLESPIQLPQLRSVAKPKTSTASKGRPSKDFVESSD